MISKQLLKYIRQLDSRKFRLQNQAFLAEGSKSVEEMLTRFTPIHIVATQEWLDQHCHLCRQAVVNQVSTDELRRISLQQHPQQVLAVLHLPPEATPPTPDNNQLVLALDGIQDPGNLGTIIRIADWYGIRHIVCSNETADAYNPKTVQASMGSLSRVELCRTDLAGYLRCLSAHIPVMGTTLDGDNINTTPLPTHGVLIMGNEGNGISQEVRQLLTHRLFIPRFPLESRHPESLNVAIATAIVCAAIRK